MDRELRWWHFGLNEHKNANLKEKGKLNQPTFLKSCSHTRIVSPQTLRRIKRLPDRTLLLPCAFTRELVPYPADQTELELYIIVFPR